MISKQKKDDPTIKTVNPKSNKIGISHVILVTKVLADFMEMAMVEAKGLNDEIYYIRNRTKDKIAVGAILPIVSVDSVKLPLAAAAGRVVKVMTDLEISE